MSIEGRFEYASGQAPSKVAGPSLVTEAARDAGLVLNTSCAGRGTCGGCTVELLSGTYRREGKTFTVLEGQRVRVHGCQTHIVDGPFRIFVPRRSLVETGEKVVADFILENHYEHQPTILTLHVTLPKPVLEDPRGDVERLVELLAGQYDLHVTGVNLTALRRLPRLTQSDECALTIRLAWCRDGQWELLDVEGDNREAMTCGVAVDIGTTTVAASLVDMDAGKIVDTVTCYNQQIQQADDVAARIAYAGTDHGLEQLHRLIVQDTLAPLIAMLARKHQLDPQQIMRLVVSGNTVMWHLFAGIDPTPLGAIPFSPASNRPTGLRAETLGLNIHPQAPVDIVPSISAYVGGDVVSDMHICKLGASDDTELLIDIGTNGEIALCADGHMRVTACAAGPAFEGLRISCGMRASVGAIEHIKIDPETGQCEYRVIGQAEPVGICGSGLIDFLAQALHAGLIDHAGKLNRDLLGRNDRIRQTTGSNMLEYVVAFRRDTEDQQRDVTVTEKDIEILLQGKAAIFSAIHILLQRSGKTIGDLGRVYLAGGFARYINVKNAISIGLLPEIDPTKYIVLGNSSLAGAFLGLIDRSSWAAFDEIISKPRVVELNLDPSFQDEYTFALFLPHFEKDLFPNTARQAGARS